jgi:hypothetical protein
LLWLARQVLYHLSDCSSPCSGYFENGVFQTAIVPISASQIARVTGLTFKILDINLTF